MYIYIEKNNESFFRTTCHPHLFNFAGLTINRSSPSRHRFLMNISEGSLGNYNLFKTTTCITPVTYCKKGHRLAQFLTVNFSPLPLISPFFPLLFFFLLPASFYDSLPFTPFSQSRHNVGLEIIPLSIVCLPMHLRH